MRVRLLAVVLTVAAIAAAPAAAAAASTPAPAPTAHTAVLAAPKFILHAGLAFGAFHHFIYKPFKDGKFTSGGRIKRTLTYTKAGVAGLFTYHEVKEALKAAQGNKALKFAVAPLTLLVARFGDLKDLIKGKNLDESSLSDIEDSVTGLEKTAKGKGADLREAVPSAGQLAKGAA